MMLYPRVCAKCGDVKEVTYRPKKDTLCASCSMKQLGKSMGQKNIKDTYKRYWYFCSNCSNVIERVSRRKSTLCASCSRKLSKTKPRQYYFDMESMMIVPKIRYYRICPDCPEESNTVEVTSALNSGIKLCKACLNKRQRARPKKKYKRKKHYTPVGVDGKQKVKIEYQIVDEKTMEAPVKKREPKILPQLSEEESRRMQDEFLKRRNDEKLSTRSTQKDEYI